MEAAGLHGLDHTQRKQEAGASLDSAWTDGRPPCSHYDGQGLEGREGLAIPWDVKSEKPELVETTSMQLNRSSFEINNTGNSA